MFKRKEKSKTVEVTPKKNAENVLARGSKDIKDMFAPPSFDRSFEDYMKVGDKYARSFIMHGFPSNVSVGWLDELYSYDGDMDTQIHIQPSDDRSALDELTHKITQFEAQLSTETEKGSIRNVTRLQNIVRQLYAQRERIEQNYENLFHVQIATNLYTDSVESLDKETKNSTIALEVVKSITCLYIFVRTMVTSLPCPMQTVMFRTSSETLVQEPLLRVSHFTTRKFHIQLEYLAE